MTEVVPGLAIGDSATALCRFVGAGPSGADRTVPAVITGESTLRCAAPDVAAAVQAPLQLSFAGDRPPRASRAPISRARPARLAISCSRLLR